MALAALRREGRRFAPMISPRPITALRSSPLAPSLEDEGPIGVRYISTQVVRNRMKSVKNIQKITKAMKMVAASKLRAIQTKAENSRGLWQPFTALLGDLPSADVKKNVVVTISSDKGLCGGINSTSVKISKGLHKLNSGPEKETKYVILGEKAKAQLIRDSKKDIELIITELQKNPLNYTQVSVLADEILKNVEYDALRIVFNKFHSVVSFVPTVSTVLSPEIVEREAESGGPSVSRVMREASFSSPAVKATIEQSLNSTSSNSANTTGPIGLGFRPVVAPTPAVAAPSANRNLYLNPRLQQGAAGQQRNEEVKRVIDILMRSKKMNPVLVGESEPELVVKEILRKIKSKEIDGVLRNVEVLHLEKDFALDKTLTVAKIKELATKVGAMIGNLDCGGVILDLGDLKWLVESNQPVGLAGGVQQQQQQQQVVSEAGRAAVVEMGKLLGRFGEGNGRVWLIGTATCETYLRCQVYHPSMENDWDLQAVPIAARAPSPGMFSRLGSNGILGSSVESLSPLKGFATTAAQPRQPSENFDPTRKTGCCPQCMQNYKQDLTRLLAAKEHEQRSSDFKSEPTRPALPQWLQNAKAHDSDIKTMDQAQAKDQDMIWTQKTQELQKKWNDTCLHVHPSFHQPSLGSERFTPAALSMTSLYNSSLLGRQPFQPKLPLNKNTGEALQLNPSLVASQPMEQASSPPGSPVKTDLVLGRPKIIETSPEKPHKERLRDFLGSIPSEPQNKFQDLQSNQLLNTLDIESFKKLLKGLTEKVWWQRDAASAVATTVTQCKLGNGKRRGTGSKGDIWLLFTGPDKVGKKKMALALSDQVCRAHPVVICLGSRRGDGESDVHFRGKTVVDKIAEAVRRNPFSVVVLEDIDEADMLVRGSIKRAMERGRLADSHGREISLGNVIFILTANWLPGNLNLSSNGIITLDEKKLVGLASGGWQLKLSLSEKTAKRQASWLHDEDRATKPRKETGSLSFDLNEAADVEDDKADGSHNSSDLTVDHEEGQGLTNRQLSNSTSSSVPHELLNSVDDAIIFKPVDFGPIRRDISDFITKKFCSVIGDRVTIKIVDEALEKITSGVWIGRTGLEEWTEKALVPSLQQLKTRLPASEESSLVFRLELDSETCNQNNGDWLPGSVKVDVDDGF